MHILITGGTGLIGQALCAHWQKQGHSLTVLSRTPERVAALCSGARGIAGLEALQHHDTQIDAIVNLAGAPIADQRWTQKRRRILWESRVNLTEALVPYIDQQEHKPAVLLSSSAVGWYGNYGETTITEQSPAHQTDFGSELCIAWENAALRAQDFGVRVATIRTAPVLSDHGGMLGRMAPLFRLGLGGRMGSGTQWMPWVHLQDIVQIYDHLLHNEACSGPYNASAPQQVRNTEFTQTLARTVKRPAICTAPAALLRLALGDMASMVLNSQKIVPAQLEATGYTWAYPTLDHALAACLSQKR